MRRLDQGPAARRAPFPQSRLWWRNDRIKLHIAEIDQFLGHAANRFVVSNNAINAALARKKQLAGGISGIYSAWRLVTADPTSVRILARPVSTGSRLRVTVFEGSQRVGGRLLSVHAPDLSAICELGGMRFASSHRRVISLINELNLPTHSFYTSHPQNHVLLRGKHLRVSDLNSPELLPYRLTAAEQECVRKNGPDVLIQCALMKLLPGLSELHGDELKLAHRGMYIALSNQFPSAGGCAARCPSTVTWRQPAAGES